VWTTFDTLPLERTQRWVGVGSLFLFRSNPPCNPLSRFTKSL